MLVLIYNTLQEDPQWTIIHINMLQENTQGAIIFINGIAKNTLHKTDNLCPISLINVIYNASGVLVNFSIFLSSRIWFEILNNDAGPYGPYNLSCIKLCLDEKIQFSLGFLLTQWNSYVNILCFKSEVKLVNNDVFWLPLQVCINIK